jgi:Na+-driven multidrug efflux pump
MFAAAEAVAAAAVGQNTGARSSEEPTEQAWAALGVLVVCWFALWVGMFVLACSLSGSLSLSLSLSLSHAFSLVSISVFVCKLLQAERDINYKFMYLNGLNVCE